MIFEFPIRTIKAQTGLLKKLESLEFSKDIKRLIISLEFLEPVILAVLCIIWPGSCQRRFPYRDSFATFTVI